MHILDPWRDASTIATRLQQAGAELHVIIGAESWCAKCAQLRPQWEAYVQGLPSDDRSVWLWLNLEMHAEFFPGFIPDDLPLYVIYREGELVSMSVVRSISQDAITTQAYAPHDSPAVAPPSIYQALTQDNWSSEK